MNLNDLNREQRIAAETLEGPVLVLAGAGTGKTKMLTYRVANLIDHGVSPYHIMAITFTNKAAAEMKSRIISLVGEAGNEVWVSTFHSACAKILRRDIEKLGYKRNFVIYDDNDQDVLLKQILAKMNLDQKEYQLRTVKSMISQAKQKLLNPKEWLKSVEFTQRNERISEIYQMYEVRMKENNALDFNDLINKTLELFTMHPPVLQYYHHLIRYLHVDEYQDTDYAQYMLVTLLAQEERNLCVVGDDDQSIYSWRGADIRNIQNFQVDFPEAKVIKLERNYRSSANILDAANQVITGNKNRMDKSLWTEREDGDKIV
ncbi:MAG: UvrD-helicase domain-containing protein, partial [Clostridia bacterium]|nr:UvrD-helicase domain-containing protein [Clostridia bacterium]